jgi:hypothetical protein
MKEMKRALARLSLLRLSRFFFLSSRVEANIDRYGQSVVALIQIVVRIRVT